MGSSFALALKKARPDVTVVGSDRNPVVVRKAIDREIVATANTDLSVVEVADVVVVGAPLHAMRELLAQLAVKAAGKPITDMASTKATVMEWAAAEGIDLAAGGFRDMSRLAAGDPDLYAGVARTNRQNLIEMLDAVSAELARLRRHLEADDPRLIELFEEARDVRERWAKS